MRKNCKLLVSYIGIITFVILIPFILDYLYSTHWYNSNLASSEWSSFNGSYIGAIMGGIITLVGVWVTIRFTREQANEDRRLSITPYLKYDLYKGDKVINKEPYITMLCTLDSKYNESYYAIMRIKNIGMGPAINIDIYDIYNNNKKSDEEEHLDLHYEALEKDGEYFVHIYITFLLGEIGISTEYIHKEIILSIKIAYEDLYHNQYNQQIEMYMDLEYESNIDEHNWIFKYSSLRIDKLGQVLSRIKK